MRLFQCISYKVAIILFWVFLVPCFSQALASDSDPLSLASGPDADIIAAIATEAEKAMYKDLLGIMELMNDPKDQEKSKQGLEKFDKFISEHPSYSDSYLLRAMFLYTMPGNKQYTRILEDINNSIKFHPTSTPKSTYEDTAAMYGSRAKVYKDTGNLEKAIEDLETAVNINHRNAIDHSGTSPNDKTEGGQWGKKDFDEIIRNYPKDYRGYLFRAVYYYNFGILLKPRDYAFAIADFKKVLSLNPKCSKAYYLLAGIMDQQLIFGKKSKEKYQKEAMAHMKGQSTWMVYPEECKKIANALTNAIKTNPQMKEAYLSRATLYLNTQNYSLAIKDYDKVIKLDPDYGGAYHDRGLAHMKIGEYWKAVDDFTNAIDAKKKITSKYYGYWNRANAYAKTDRFNQAIDDYTKAIELHIGELVILMNLSQFRSIYPEYDYLDDDALITKLHNKFFPNIEPNGFAKSMSEKEKTWASTSAFELYDNRGDTYLKFGYFGKATEDYNRAIRIYPDYPIERWKYITETAYSKCYLDIRTVEKQSGNIYKFWIKHEYTKTKPQEVSHSIQSMSLDCSSKKIRTLSNISYDDKRNPFGSYDTASEWKVVIPETMGEVLYKGWCSY